MERSRRQTLKKKTNNVKFGVKSELESDDSKSNNLRNLVKCEVKLEKNYSTDMKNYIKTEKISENEPNTKMKSNSAVRESEITIRRSKRTGVKSEYKTRKSDIPVIATKQADYKVIKSDDDSPEISIPKSEPKDTNLEQLDVDTDHFEMDTERFEKESKAEKVEMNEELRPVDMESEEEINEESGPFDMESEAEIKKESGLDELKSEAEIVEELGPVEIDSEADINEESGLIDNESVEYLEENEELEPLHMESDYESIQHLVTTEFTDRESGDYEKESVKDEIGIYSYTISYEGDPNVFPSTEDLGTEIHDTLPVEVPKRKKNKIKVEEGFNTCNQCGYASADIASLAVHMISHSNTIPLKCSLCNYTSERKRYLVSHIKNIHGKANIYMCEYCVYSTTYKRTFESHMAIHTGEKRYKCNECKFTTVIKGALVKHINVVHIGKKPFSCKDCKFQTAHKESLMAHRRIHTGEKPYMCDECSFATAHRYSLKMHRLTHTTEKPFKCNLCDYSTAYKNSFYSHKLTHTGGSFQCDKCEYQTKNRTCLLVHERSHKGMHRKHICDQCEYSTIHKRNLAKHLLIHTRKLYKCNKCNFSTVYETKFKNHEHTTNFVPYKCAYCQYIADTKKTVVQHIRRKHTELKKTYACEMCAYKTSQKNVLLRHMSVVHNQDNPFKCSQCAFETVFKVKFSIHLKTHSGDHPYKCDVCDYETCHRINMENHKQMHRGEKNYKCSKCNYSSIYSSHILRHIKAMHKNDQVNLYKVSNNKLLDDKDKEMQTNSINVVDKKEIHEENSETHDIVNQETNSKSIEKTKDVSVNTQANKNTIKTKISQTTKAANIMSDQVAKFKKDINKALELGESNQASPVSSPEKKSPKIDKAFLPTTSTDAHTVTNDISKVASTFNAKRAKNTKVMGTLDETEQKLHKVSYTLDQVNNEHSYENIHTPKALNSPNKNKDVVKMPQTNENQSPLNNFQIEHTMKMLPCAHCEFQTQLFPDLIEHLKSHLKK